MILSLAGKLRLTPEAATGLLLEYPPLTLAFYDKGPSSGPEQIGPAEIGRLIVIEPLNQKVAVSLLNAGTSAPWHLLPADARLEDADPEGDLYWAATDLYEFFDRLPDIGSAIASKVLHLKRPAFFPILDSVVHDLYKNAAKIAYDASFRAKAEVPNARRLYWAAIREDLLLAENRLALDAVRTILRHDKRPQAAQLASLTNVRLMDILAWQNRS